MRFMMMAAATAALTLSTACAQAKDDTAPAEAVAAANTWVVDPTHTSITWKVMHLGLSNYTARFTDFDATLVFDPASPETASLSVTINPLSVATDYKGDFKATHPDSASATWDEELATGDRFFRGDEFPQITYTSTGITVTGENTGTVTGDLTFLGVTKPVTLDVTFNGSGEFWGTQKAGFSATGTISRSEFGMDGLAGAIGDDVQLIIEAEFAAAAAE